MTFSIRILSINCACQGCRYIPNFCTLIDKVLEFSDSLPLIRAIHEDLNGFFIANTQATNIEIDDETKDPLEFGNIYIIQC